MTQLTAKRNFESQCNEYFLCDAGLKLKRNLQIRYWLISAFATKTFEVFESQFPFEYYTSTKFNQFIIFASSLKFVVFYAQNRMLMRKNLNNDVCKDSPILYTISNKQAFF